MIAPQPVLNIISPVNSPMIVIQIFCSICHTKVTEDRYDVSVFISNGEAAVVADQGGIRSGNAWLQHAAIHGKPATA